MDLFARQETVSRHSAGGVDSLSWTGLNEILMDLPEDDVLAMLEEELEGKRRKTYVVRLHKRYSVLRMKRERNEMKKPR